MNAVADLRMEDLLGSLGGEQEHNKRELELEEDSVLVEMCKGFEASLRENKTCESLGDMFMKCCGCVEPIEYCARDVEQFSLALEQYQSEDGFPYWAGMYLSALINHCQNKYIPITTTHLEDLYSIGFMNEGRTLVITGDGGFNLGSYMSAGRIVVTGDVADHVGDEIIGGEIHIQGSAGNFLGDRMRGGKIVVNKDAGKGLGRWMSDGEIVVQGSAGYNVGDSISGGEIRVEGDYLGLSFDTEGGDIYQKGIQIVKDGMVIRKEYFKF